MAATQDVKGKGEGGDQNFDYMFKLLIIGNSSVGKTSFLFRYADDAFTSAFVSTVGIDFKVKTVYKNDKRIKLQIWVWNINILSIKHLEGAPNLSDLWPKPKWDGVVKNMLFLFLLHSLAGQHRVITYLSVEESIYSY